MELKPSQQAASDEIFNLFRSGHNRVVLKGSAGTGKTFLSNYIINQLVKDYTVNQNYNNGLVFATAPTNKALAVLKGKVNARAEFKTIQSACEMRRVINNKTGAEYFVMGAYLSSNNPFKNCKAAILDETSMVDSNILKAVNQFKFPILFIGDDKQINPVNEPFSPIFGLDYPTVTLTEIIRQGAGNPIIELSNDLDMIPFKQPSFIEGKGYVYDNNRGNLIDALAEVNGTDEMKYLSWTNRDVDEMNKYTRERRYGNPKRIEKDETIVFNKPFESHYTNKELKVERVAIVTDWIPIPNEKTRFDENNVPINATDRIKMKFYRINDSVNVVHEDSDVVYKKVFDTLVDNAKNYGWGWKGKFFFAEMFADIKYNHAITVHKSQGSTYKHTIVNVGNINFNSNKEEKTRLLYTAVTRASDLVILNNVK